MFNARRRAGAPALILAVLVVTGTAEGAVHIVTQVANGFSPDEVTIARGDTVRWVWTGGIHTVTSGSGASDPESGALFDAPLDGTPSSFSYRFLSAGDVPYYCIPHEAFGMTGMVHVNPGATTFTVQALAFSFSPDSISIQVGDTVRWQRSSGTHTVTSGFGPTDPRSGDLFDGALNQIGGPHSFSHTFGDTTGVYPYYCGPHFDFGMTGVVRVADPTTGTGVELPPESARSWGWLKNRHLGHELGGHHH
jgi:plastocyanin